MSEHACYATVVKALVCQDAIIGTPAAQIRPPVDATISVDANVDLARVFWLLTKNPSASWQSILTSQLEERQRVCNFFTPECSLGAAARYAIPVLEKWIEEVSTGDLDAIGQAVVEGRLRA